jgi:hypothetical protein
MDRRKSLKLIATGAIAGVAVAGCKTDNNKEKPASTEPVFELDRNPDEVENEKALLAKGKFFTDHEMATITVLADIIIPKDEVSGSASEAKVPEFIDFIVRDMPTHQIPMRGGLRWLDMHSLKKFEKVFTDCDATQQLQIVDEIAYPVIKYSDESGKKIEKGSAKPGVEQGIAFFSLMRNLTATGFYTSAIGVKDIGYVGNTSNKWNGVPDEVLQQHKLAYTEKELAESVKFT